MWIVENMASICEYLCNLQLEHVEKRDNRHLEQMWNGVLVYEILLHPAMSVWAGLEKASEEVAEWY